MFDKKSKVPQFFASSMRKFSRDVTSLKIIIFSGVIDMSNTMIFVKIQRKTRHLSAYPQMKFSRKTLIETQVLYIF